LGAALRTNSVTAEERSCIEQRRARKQSQLKMADGRFIIGYPAVRLSRLRCALVPEHGLIDAALCTQDAVLESCRVQQSSVPCVCCHCTDLATMANRLSKLWALLTPAFAPNLGGGGGPACRSGSIAQVVGVTRPAGFHKSTCSRPSSRTAPPPVARPAARLLLGRGMAQRATLQRVPRW